MNRSTASKHILVAGVRHRSAPIEIRERCALSAEEVQQAIPRLLALPAIGECAILSTCNRTEIYVAVEDTAAGLQSIKTFFRDFKGFDFDAHRAAVFVLMHEDAAIHLFRVASGLDSLILGEGQILAQVKDTLLTAANLKATGIVVDRLFKTALSIGKRVRTETGIAQRDSSVSRAAYEFAKQQAPDLLDRSVALVGGGKMAEIIMASLKREMTPAQQARVTIVNRSESRLQALTEKFGFRGVDWNGMPAVLDEADVLFVATGAPHTVLHVEDFQHRGPKLILDISVPRNVDVLVEELPHIRLYNTDHLAGMNGFSPETQDVLRREAQNIIDEAYREFHHWWAGLPVVPTITLLRSKMETIRQSEASCLCPVTNTSCSVIDTLSKNLVNKILHDPTVRLKSTHNLEEIYQQAALLSQLFNIPQPEEAPSPVAKRR